MKRLMLCSVFCGTMVVTTGCSGLVQHSMFGSDEGGYVSINTDAAGMYALSDWQTGMVNEVRTPEGQKGSHYQLREHQEAQKTIRIQIPKMKKEAK